MGQLHTLLLFALLVPEGAWASPKSDITKGAIMSQLGDHEQALQNLRDGLSHREELKTSDIEKGTFALVNTLLQLHASRLMDASTNPETHQLAIEAATVLRQLPPEEEPSESRQNKVEEAKRKLHYALYNGAVVCMNAVRPGDTTYGEWIKLSETLVKQARIADPNSPESALVHSQLASLLKKDDEAYDASLAALKNHQQNPPPLPSTNFFFPGYTAAVIARKKGQLEPALSHLALGRERGTADYERLENPSDLQQRTYESWILDYTKMEIQLLSEVTGREAEAIDKIESYLSLDPDHIILRIMLAGLLERNLESNRSREQYQYVLKVKPEDYTTNLNYALTYYNEGARFIRRDREEGRSASPEAVEAFTHALPLLEAAQKLAPTEPAPLQALVTVCMFLGRVEELTKWEAAVEALGTDLGEQ